MCLKRGVNSTSFVFKPSFCGQSSIHLLLETNAEQAWSLINDKEHLILMLATKKKTLPDRNSPPELWTSAYEEKTEYVIDEKPGRCYNYIKKYDVLELNRENKFVKLVYNYSGSLFTRRTELNISVYGHRNSPRRSAVTILYKTTHTSVCLKIALFLSIILLALYLILRSLDSNAFPLNIFLVTGIGTGLWLTYFSFMYTLKDLNDKNMKNKGKRIQCYCQKKLNSYIV
eukprot:snap_masked-scaffold_1-processed-gene-8.26-mRNA-1 protein AED:1.00 eAED:1.00 QI:0/-1/0/0/-1/1/1/0/228